MFDIFRRWAQPAIVPRTPEGERIYAVGDIHGRLDLLRKLHDLIAADAKGADAAVKTIVYLGDYVDRGLDSRGVIDCLMDETPAGLNAVYLKGNHEAVTLEFLDDAAVGEDWLQFGGDATLYSYGVQLAGTAGGQRNLIDAQLTFRENLPDRHLSFLRSLRSQCLIGDYLFVHAGVKPGVPVAEQRDQDLLWIRGEFLNSKADHGAMVVHGHSISLEGEDKPNRVNIDTGAYATGVLTCLVMDGDKRWKLQT
jgi:serine/threonine protein phosphatase 1